MCSAVMLSGPAALPDFSLCIAVEISWMLIFPCRMLLSLMQTMRVRAVKINIQIQ